MTFFHRSRLCRAPNPEKVITALSLELSGILWWNFAYTLILTRCTPWDCQMTFEIGWVFAVVQLFKKVRLLQDDIYNRSRLCWATNSEKVKMAYLLNWVEYFDRLLRKHWYWQDLAQEIGKYNFSSVEICRAPNSENVKMALSLELNGILCWNFAYTLILTWCSPWDSKVTFGIGRGFAVVQFLKTVKFNS